MCSDQEKQGKTEKLPLIGGEKMEDMKTKCHRGFWVRSQKEKKKTLVKNLNRVY